MHRRRLAFASKLLGIAAGFLLLTAASSQALIATLTADPTTVVEPGGEVEYTLTVECEGTDSCDLASLSDTLGGSLDGEGTCQESQDLLITRSYSCTFTREVTGSAGETVTNTVEIVGRDDFGGERRPSASADVLVTAAPEDGGGSGGGQTSGSCFDGEPSVARISGCVDRHVAKEFRTRGVPNAGSSITVINGGDAGGGVTRGGASTASSAEIPTVEDLDRHVRSLLD